MRLELVVVQLEEAKRLVEIRRIPQLRLALILLDGAVELIMHRMAEAELQLERFSFDQLENLRKLEAMRQSDKPFNRRFATAGPSDDQLCAEIKRLEATVTSKGKRKRIHDVFGDKVDFLVENGRLPKGPGPVLKKLHDYRNETYHRDEHRVELLLSTVLIYFDAACTVLDQYKPSVMIGVGPFGPELSRVQDNAPERRDPFELPHLAATQLRKEVGLDLAAVRTALVEHLLGRLYDLEAGLTYIEENSASEAIAGDAIRMMQIEEGDLEAIFKNDVLRSREYPLTMRDARSWIARATAMESMDDKYALFSEFAALEDAFEVLERKVSRAVWQIDENANMR